MGTRSHRPLAGSTLRAVGGRAARAAAATVLVVAALAGWGPAPPASAHGTLLSSDPAEAAVVESLPSRARLTFSDTVAEVREVTVVGPDGSVTNGVPTSLGPEVVQTLWAGPAGEYVLGYFVVSADGHDVRGEVHFSVEPAADVESAGGSVGGEDRAAAVRPGRAAVEETWWQRGRAAGPPIALVLTGLTVALTLVRRRRGRVG